MVRFKIIYYFYIINIALSERKAFTRDIVDVVIAISGI